MPSSTSASSQTPSLKDIPHALNPFFTGRSKILHELHEALTEWRVVVVNGPPPDGEAAGLGRTEVGVTYAHRHREHYRRIFWLRADSPCTLVEDCLRALAATGAPPDRGRSWDQAVPALRDWLGSHQRWLLVLDNVAKSDLVKAVLPEPVPGHVLALARRSASSALGVSRAVMLPGLPPEEGLRFLFKRTGRVDNDPAERRAATELISLLDGMPLALDLAGAYLSALDLPFRQYLGTLRDRLSTPSGSSRPQAPDDLSRVTALLCWDGLEQASPPAAACLKLGALFGRERLSLGLLRELGDEAGADLAPFLTRAAEESRAGGGLLEPLVRFGLVRRTQDPTAFSLHPGVQRAVTARLDRATAERWAAALGRTVERVCLAEDEPARQAPERTLPWLDVAAALGQAGWMRSTEQARLLERLATGYLPVSGFTVTEPLFVGALDAHKSDQDDGRAVAALAHELARQYAALGRRAQSDRYFTQALAARERVLGPMHNEVADYLHDLARRYDEQGRHLQADGYYGRSLAIREHNAGKRHPEVAAYLHLLGCRYGDLGRRDEADACFRRALAIKEEAHGAMHPAVAAYVHELACRLGEQARYEEAAPLFERAVAIARSTLPPGHPDLGTYLHSLGRFYHSTGKLRDAEGLYKQALVHTEQMTAAQVAAALNDLGGLYHQRGRYAKAEPLLQQALAMARKALPADHPNLAISLNNLAAVQIARRRHAEAEPLLQQALALSGKRLTADHPDLLTILDNLAAVLRKLKRGEEADAVAARAANIRAGIRAAEDAVVAAEG